MTKYTITQEEASSILGRPLTDFEKENFEESMALSIEDVLAELEFEGETLPFDLKQLIVIWWRDITNTFNEAYEKSVVSSKSIEDFSVTYKTNEKTAEASLREKFARVFAKYGGKTIDTSETIGSVYSSDNLRRSDGRIWFI